MWRCRGSVTRRHKETFLAHLNSFFKGSHFDVQEILAFIREWLLKSSLHRCAVASGMDYKKTSVDWANFMRDMCRKFVDGLYSNGNKMFLGEVEIMKVCSADDASITKETTVDKRRVIPPNNHLPS